MLRDHHGNLVSGVKVKVVDSATGEVLSLREADEFTVKENPFIVKNGDDSFFVNANPTEGFDVFYIREGKLAFCLKNEINRSFGFNFESDS